MCKPKEYNVSSSSVKGSQEKIPKLKHEKHEKHKIYPRKNLSAQEVFKSTGK